MREVVRCIHCKLNQFVTVSGLCRKCGKVPVFVAEPDIVAEVEPIVIENKNFPIKSSELALALWLCRIGSEMSQRDLGKAMGVPRTWFSKIENGHVTPTVQNLLKFAHALNLTPQGILEMAEAMASA